MRHESASRNESATGRPPTYISVLASLYLFTISSTPLYIFESLPYHCPQSASPPPACQPLSPPAGHLASSSAGALLSASAAPPPPSTSSGLTWPSPARGEGSGFCHFFQSSWAKAEETTLNRTLLSLSLENPFLSSP